ncbi:MAG TPA: acetate kinase [Sedimenticola thiotaurini]|uniref:Acetate kinase n=1 Tax=Sedimenticola thiotaurini TaxID=1543721 RepID=A0A831W4R7_9GAMM|nr:acetate kinase [Sedimenticola thiotaurini]
MKILVLNSGSSSIKFQLFDSDGWRVVAAGMLSRIGEPDGELTLRRGDGEETRAGRVADHHQGLETIFRALAGCGAVRAVEDLDAVGHRVVHGGEAFREPVRIDDAVVAAIRETIALAPLHNPANLDGIEVARRLLPAVPQVAVFDTAFHQTMPPAAYRYALPQRLYRDHRVRRYGFHGTSHRYVAAEAARFLGLPPEQCNLISLHLGNGASACAIEGGRSVDTSMGMTPLEGLVMGTRSGDIDPAIPFYLQREAGMSPARVESLLNRESGLTGLCGAADMRQVHRLAQAGDDTARLALEVTVHRLKKYLGAYYAVLGRVDAVVFTGGIGENDAWLRAAVCQGLERLGIGLAAAANRESATGVRDISAAGSAVRVLVVPTDEELEIARQTRSLLD